MAYVKTHTAWAATDPLTAAAMNNLETQWSEMKALVDGHNHDTRYYVKATADATFFSTSYFTGFDADLIDGTQLSAIISSIMPIGAIMMWHGSDGDIPDDWYVCDGNAHGGYTTPNLTERFVVCAGSTYAVNATGGPATWNGTITPTGSVVVGAHTLTTAELPSHDHSYTEYYPALLAEWSTNGTVINAITSKSVTTSNQTSGGGSHGHTGSTATFTAIDPRPSYYAIYFIMKCA